MRVAITGGAGAGKSTAVNYLKENLSNTAFHDVDAMVRDIHKNAERYFDSGMLQQWRELTNVPNLREAIFTNPQRRIALEQLSAPIVKSIVNEICKGSNLIIEFPLLFEKMAFAEIINNFDMVVVLNCSAYTRKNRCRGRGWSEDAIANVFSAQVSDMNRIDIAMELSTRMKVEIINTEYTVEKTITDALRVLQIIRAF